MSKFFLKKLVNVVAAQMYNTADAFFAEDKEVREDAAVRALAAWVCTGAVIFAMLIQYQPQCLDSFYLKEWLSSLYGNSSFGVIGWCVALIVIPLIGDLVTRGLGYDCTASKVTKRCLLEAATMEEDFKEISPLTFYPRKASLSSDSSSGEYSWGSYYREHSDSDYYCAPKQSSFEKAAERMNRKPTCILT